MVLQSWIVRVPYKTGIYLISSFDGIRKKQSSSNLLKIFRNFSDRLRERNFGIKINDFLFLKF